jgi:mono/diheme cytochrome c family protein
MKKALKMTGYVLGLFLLVLLFGASYIQFSDLPKYEVKVPEYPLFKPDSSMIAEGKRTFTLICNNCHLATSGKLEGKYLPEIPAMFGKAWSANITSHAEHGIGRYSNGELAYLLRTGIQRDGDFVPFMPTFTHLSDSDLQNIIAYLRSGAPELAPSDVVQPSLEPTFMTKALARVAFKPAPYPEKPISLPPPGDQVALGRYLVIGKLDCYSCHCPDFMTLNVAEPEKTPGYLSGGNKLQDLEGNTILSRNLTPDPETGLGKWTEEQFVKTLKIGIRPNAPMLRFPMIPYAALTDEEAKAIWAYLQTVPAVRNDVDQLEK